MSGLFETAIEKMDVLIAALNENTKARLAGAGDGGTAAAAADKPKATRGKAADKAAEGPKTTEAELVAKFEELKATDTEKRMPRLKKIIADLGFTSLKELRVSPPKFDEAMDALKAYETELAAAPADDEDDL